MPRPPPQDCTVQHLRNELAVAVYEAHARASLEYGDLAEFNQCQTQLHMFYDDGAAGCRAEFTAYKLLYHSVHSRQQNRALLHTMQGLAASPDVAASPAVQHALQVRQALMTANYGRFFRLYAVAPGLGRALMDAQAGGMRWAALNVLTKAYKTSLPVSFLTALLGFQAAATAGAAVAVAAPAAAPGGAAAVCGLPLFGCRKASFAGKYAAVAEADAAMEACCAWLEAHGAVLDVAAAAEGRPAWVHTTARRHAFGFAWPCQGGC